MVWCCVGVLVRCPMCTLTSKPCILSALLCGVVWCSAHPACSARVCWVWLLWCAGCHYSAEVWRGGVVGVTVVVWCEVVVWHVGVWGVISSVVLCGWVLLQNCDVVVCWVLLQQCCVTTKWDLCATLPPPCPTTLSAMQLHCIKIYTKQ